jgi:hypothetical protein
MNFVLDASVTLAWAFDDERDREALAALERLRAEEAVVASLWPLEVTNGLLAAERRGRITAADGTRFLHLVRSLPVVVDPVARERSRRHTRLAAPPSSWNSGFVNGRGRGRPSWTRAALQERPHRVDVRVILLEGVGDRPVQDAMIDVGYGRTGRGSGVSSQRIDLSRQVLPTRNHGELAGPVGQIIPVQVRAFAADDARRVLQVARAAGEQLVKEQVLGGRERDLSGPYVHQDRPIDGLGLVGRRRKDEVDSHTRRRIRGRQHERLPRERARIVGKGLQAQRFTHDK